MIRYHAGDDITEDELDAEIFRALEWANWVVVSRPSLDLVVNGDLSITIDPGDREPRLFPHGESEELSEDDIAHYLNGVERWLAEQDGDDE